MKKVLFIVLSAVLLMFSSCSKKSEKEVNPDNLKPASLHAKYNLAQKKMKVQKKSSKGSYAKSLSTCNDFDLFKELENLSDEEWEELMQDEEIASAVYEMLSMMEEAENSQSQGNNQNNSYYSNYSYSDNYGNSNSYSSSQSQSSSSSWGSQSQSSYSSYYDEEDKEDDDSYSNYGRGNYSNRNNGYNSYYESEDDSDDSDDDEYEDDYGNDYDDYKRAMDSYNDYYYSGNSGNSGRGNENYGYDNVQEQGVDYDSEGDEDYEDDYGADSENEYYSTSTPSSGNGYSSSNSSPVADNRTNTAPVSAPVESGSDYSDDEYLADFGNIVLR